METNVKFRIPSGWNDLSLPESKMLLSKLCDPHMIRETIPTYMLLAFSGIRVKGKAGKEWLLESPEGVFKSEAAAISSLSSRLNWCAEPLPYPWRPEKIAGGVPVEASLSTLTFGEWLTVDDAYQAIVYTGEFHHASSMLTALVKDTDRSLLPWEEYALFVWICAAKVEFAKEFPDFLADAPIASDPDGRSLKRQLRDSVNAQMRALTKGDITREEQVLGMPMVRAFTELDAQAREYEEIKRLQKK